MAQASSVEIHIDFEALPRFPGATDSHVLHGGEEYELLFSAPRSVAIPQSVGGIPITRIGGVTSGSGVALMRESLETALQPGGFEHLVGGR
jgi:thiamine-monophosphate kinase